MKNKKFKRKSSKYNYSNPIEGFDYCQTIDMSIEELLSRLPKYTLSDIKFLISRGVIKEFPIKAMDFEVLKRLHNIWKTVQAVILMLRKMNKKVRSKILESIEIGHQSKLESWMYSRLNNLIKKGNERIPRNKIIDEAIKVFGLKYDNRTRKRLSKILDKVIKRWKRKNGKDIRGFYKA